MYLGQGPAWANQGPPIPKENPLCSCGCPKAPGDFLCHRCRALLETHLQQDHNKTQPELDEGLLDYLSEEDV